MGSFTFQQPGHPSLLDALDASAKGASEGGGMFAFATKNGISALFSAKNIAKLLNRSFEVVVGMDAITNADAVLCLEEYTKKSSGLKAHAFLHNYPGIFHPKFSWFVREGELVLITGSGNLTPSGLGAASAGTPPQGNWEAFTTQVLRGSDASSALAEIRKWIQTQRLAGHLRGVADTDVRDQAMANSRVRIPRVRPAGPKISTPAAAGTAASRPVELDVMIRELPNTRPGQGDIGRSGLAFFGYQGSPTTSLLQYVDLKDNVGPTVEKHMFASTSANYRIEISASAAHGYQVDRYDNRMILVAVRLGERSYRYTVVPVTSPHYKDVVKLLGPITRPGHGRRMRHVKVSARAVRKVWHGAPKNLLPVNAPVAIV